MNNSVQRLNSLVPAVANSRNAVAAASAPASIMPTNFGFGKSSANAALNTGSVSGSSTPLIIFAAFLVVFLVVFWYFYDPFMNSLQNWYDSLNMWFTGKGAPAEPPPPVEPVMPLKPPSSPEEDSRKPATGLDAIVERVLPPAKDVFTVSKNNYSFYDAAPLCKALGAELATYDQVKHAWQNGADWCNYGWVKGQMAVYPTQKGTYEELQQGPAEQRGACGKPGLNGGYFDNPELKFGVTCVGKKPAQSAHDSTSLTSGATRPLTSSGLEFEKKVQQFKEDAETIGLLPFNQEKWSS